MGGDLEEISSRTWMRRQVQAIAHIGSGNDLMTCGCKGVAGCEVLELGRQSPGCKTKTETWHSPGKV